MIKSKVGRGRHTQLPKEVPRGGALMNPLPILLGVYILLSSHHIDMGVPMVERAENEKGDKI